MNPATLESLYEFNFEVCTSKNNRALIIYPRRTYNILIPSDVIYVPSERAFVARNISALISFGLVVLITQYEVYHTNAEYVSNFAGDTKVTLGVVCLYYLLSSSLCVATPLSPSPVIIACNSVITARAILNYGVT